MHAIDAGDRLDTDDALMAGFMREPGRPGDVADGVKAGRSGAAIFIDHDVAVVDAHALLLQPEPFDIAGDADGEDHALGGDLLGGAVGHARASRSRCPRP